MKTVLLGTSGFIDSHVAEQLVLAGHEADERVRGQTYLLKGYDISWMGLKQALDQARGRFCAAPYQPAGHNQDRFGSGLRESHASQQ